MKTVLAPKPLAVAVLWVLLAGCAHLSDQNRRLANPATVTLSGPEQVDFAAYRSPLQASVTDRRFNTRDAMYLANEMEIGSTDFVQAAGALGLPLDKELLYLTTVESYWYSRYNMEALNTESRCGLSLVHGPYVTLKAIAQGRANVNRDRGEYARSNKGVLMQDLLPLYMNRAGFPRRFDDASPLMLAFERCDPHLVRPLDVGGGFQSTENLIRDREFKQLYGDQYPATPYGFGTPGNSDWTYRVNYRDNFLSLRWDHARMSHVIDMAAEGQVLTKLALWAEFFMAGNHHDGQFLGITPEDGFRGATLTLSAVSKMLILKSAMLYDGQQLTGADPRSAKAADYYLPHRIGVRLRMAGDLAPRPEEFFVVDDSSQLFDQASLLWGLSEFYRFADPSFKSNWNHVFGNNTPYDGSIMEQKYIVLAEGLADIVLDTLTRKHRAEDGSLVTAWTPSQGRSSERNTADIGMAMVALANYVDKVHGDPSRVDQATQLLRSQADFLISALAGDGSVGTPSTPGQIASAGAPTLLDQGMAVRGLLAAYRTLGDSRYQTAALTIFDYMQSHLWDDATGLYRSQAGASVSVYTPQNLGAALAALREVILTTGKPELLTRYKRFWVQAINTSGIMQSEFEETGATELGQADSDHDGIARMEFGDGKYGIAPVFASRVEIATP